MSANVQPSLFYKGSILIEDEYGEEITVRKTELCELVEKVLPFAETECDELVYRVTKALLPHITEQLRADGWMPRRNYPCGCTPTLLCIVHYALSTQKSGWRNTDG
jgi:hypothetical protein